MIIFIHGIMGSPDQFKPMMSEAVRGGYAVSSMLLPGHGGTGRDFARSSRLQWETAVKEHIGRMSRRYPSIVLVGHSMGSLLALACCTDHQDSVKGVVAIATPLRIWLKPRAIRASRAVALGKINENDQQIKAAFESCSVRRSSIWTYISGIPRFLDLLLMMRSTEKILDRVKTPSLIIHSAGDEVVNIKSAAILEERLTNPRKLLLSQSGHYYYSQSDLALMIETFLRFLKTLQMGLPGPPLLESTGRS